MPTTVPPTSSVMGVRPRRSSSGGTWPAFDSASRRPAPSVSTANTIVTNMLGGRSRQSARLTLARTAPGSSSSRAAARNSVRVITMSSAAGIPFPETSPTTMPTPPGMGTKS